MGGKALQEIFCDLGVFTLIFIQKYRLNLSRKYFKAERSHLARKNSTQLSFNQNGIPCEIFKNKKPGGGLLFYTLGKVTHADLKGFMR